MTLTEEQKEDLAFEVTKRLDEMEDEIGVDNEFNARVNLDTALEQADTESVIDRELTKEEKDEILRFSERFVEDAELEPNATIVYNGEERDFITPYSHPKGFDTEWSGGSWRGHYSVKHSDDWEKISSDTILSMHPSEKELKEYQERLREEFKERGLEWVEIYPRTSNVFASGFDIFVKKEDSDEAKKISNRVKRAVGLINEKEQRMKNKFDEEVA